MNFEAWQSQQRALKEAERKRKTDAAATLHAFRGSGMSEAERKLAAAKEAERQRKLAAEKMMHDYRGAGMSEADARLAAQKEMERQAKLNAERGLHGYRSVGSPSRTKSAANGESAAYPELVSPSQDDPSKAIQPGAVSNIMNMFSGTGTPLVPESNTYSNPPKVDPFGASVENREDEMIEPRQMTMNGDTDTLSNGMAAMQMDSQPQSVPLVATPPADSISFDLPLAEQAPAEPLPVSSEPLDISQLQTAPEPQFAVPEVQTPPEPQQPLPPAVPVTERVAFQIGLILPTPEMSSMNPYTATAASLVQNLVSQDAVLSNAVSITYPVIQAVTKDESYVDPANRPGVCKYLATFVIAVTSTDADARHSARQKIYSEVRQGIQSGAFQTS